MGSELVAETGSIVYWIPVVAMPEYVKCDLWVMIPGDT